MNTANERDVLIGNGYQQTSSYTDSTATPLKSPPEKGPRDLDNSEKWSLFIALWSGIFLQALDGTIVAATATHIGDSFQQLNRVAWINTAYLLTAATFTPIYGKVSDIVGRRAAANVAWIMFTLGCLMCGTANNMEMLIAGRLVQGAGGSGLSVVGNTVLTDVCALRDRAMYASMGGMLWAAGSGVGAPFGGLCADSIGWRWAFLIQIPFMLVVHFRLLDRLTYRLPGQSDSFSKVYRRVDWAGLAAIIVSLGGLVLAMGFRTNESMPWSHPLVAGTFAVAGVATIIFLYIELRVAKEPILETRMLCDQSRLAVSMANFLCAASTASLVLFFPMMLQIVRGTGAAKSGLRLIPGTIMGSIASVLSGLIIRHTARYKWLGVVMALIILPALLALVRLGKDSPEYETWIDLPPTNAGAAGVYSSSLIAMLVGVSPTDAGTALGILILFRQLGFVLGNALSSAVQQAVLSRALTGVISDPELIDSIRKSADTIKQLPVELQGQAKDAFAVSFRAVFATAATTAVLLVISMLAVEDKDLVEFSGKGDVEDEPPEQVPVMSESAFSTRFD